MTQKANILFLHGQRDKGHMEQLQGELGYLAEALAFDLNDCSDCFAIPNDFSPLVKKISQSHIVVFIISKHSLVEFSQQQLKTIKSDLFKSADDKTLTLIAAVVDDAKTDYLPELKGRQVAKKQGDSYSEIVDSIIDSRQKLTSKFALPLSMGLLDLNYKAQRAVLKAHFVQNNFNLLNVFLIRGTKDCGHQLLMKSFLKTHGVKIEDEQRQLVKLNAREFSDFNNINWMWHQIAAKIDDKNPPANNARSIATYLFDRLQREHIFIRFNDIDYVRAESVKIVQKIWSEIYSYIHSDIQLLRKPLPFHLFLFLNDKSGSDEEYSKEHFRGDVDTETCEKVFCILPKINYLSNQDAQDWLEWVIDKNADFMELRPHLTVNSLIPKEHNEVSMKVAIENVFNVLIHLDDTLTSHKHKHLADWFPEF